ncbi:MAG: succinylglutamate desuccinylase/aspartoacylase family protein [Myxococcota bacterium]
MTRRVRRVEGLDRGTLPDCVEEFLGLLGGPVWIRVAGRDPARTRVVATLVHGNEPSGVRAVLAWLRGGTVPPTNVVFFLGAVHAALHPPGFFHRMLPGARDLNRCFAGPFEGPEGEIAAEVLEQLRAEPPEALVDLHNNTGHSPPYGVGTGVSALQLGLASLFATRYVNTDLRLGAFAEVASEITTAVTIECGRAGDPAADAVARRGLERLLAAADLEPLARGDGPVALLQHPLRVSLRGGARVAYGAAPVPGFDLTLDLDVDRHNFERLEAGAALGWLPRGSSWPLEAHDAEGRDRSREFFGSDDGRLRTLRPVVPVMVTIEARIAELDCLFYPSRDRRSAGVAIAPLTR